MIFRCFFTRGKRVSNHGSGIYPSASLPESFGLIPDQFMQICVGKEAGYSFLSHCDSLPLSLSFHQYSTHINSFITGTMYDSNRQIHSHSTLKYGRKVKFPFSNYTLTIHIIIGQNSKNCFILILLYLYIKVTFNLVKLFALLIIYICQEI